MWKAWCSAAALWATQNRPPWITDQGQLLLRAVRPAREASSGPNKAIVALTNSILAVAWHLLTNGALYIDPGRDFFDRRNDPAREAKRLQHRIEALGFEVTLAEKAA